ncbi:MAG: hypothetical protein JST40_05710 [Armatimonadetes bacterium]|nr:hypothetical protein [Armatimonadota bacterium]
MDTSKPKISRNHPLYGFFEDKVSRTVERHIQSFGLSTTCGYLTDVLVSFIHTDSIFSICKSSGERVISVAEMIAEGEMLASADSFERERDVHKHIGDFILFWEGVYPEFLRRIRMVHGQDIICNYPKQAQQSYLLVSTFEPQTAGYTPEVYRILSEGFEDFTFCLRIISDDLGLGRRFA